MTPHPQPLPQLGLSPVALSWTLCVQGSFTQWILGPALGWACVVLRWAGRAGFCDSSALQTGLWGTVGGGSGRPIHQGWEPGVTPSPGPQVGVKPSTGLDLGTLCPKAWGPQKETGLGQTKWYLALLTSSCCWKQTIGSFQQLRRQLGDRDSPQPCLLLGIGPALSPPWAQLRGQQFLRLQSQSLDTGQGGLLRCRKRGWGGLGAPAPPRSSPAQPQLPKGCLPSLPPVSGSPEGQSGEKPDGPDTQGDSFIHSKPAVCQRLLGVGARAGTRRDRAHCQRSSYGEGQPVHPSVEA